MTKKLYEKDPYKKSFTAKVISVKDKDGKYHVVLDKTYFYPEGGGQPGDRGTIDGVEVLDVIKRDNNIIHILKKDLPEGKLVDCNIDWKRRYAFMQQHTGQHLLSAVLKNEYDLNTVGFTLSEDTLRIDTDKKITSKKLKKIESKVNSLIQEGIDIKTVYPDKNQLEKLTLRKEPTVNENIRVIQIGGVDYSPCGGTHLDKTSELGIIKITDTANYKGGLRIDFVCGNRALSDYDKKNSIILKLKELLSSPESKIIDQVHRFKEKLDKYENQIDELNEKLLNYMAEELIDEAVNIGDVKVIKKTFNNISYNRVQYLSDIICKNNNIIIIFGQHDDSSARLLLARSENIKKIKMNEIINKPLELIEGRGGGNKSKAQGGGDLIDNLDKAIDEAFEIIKRKIKTS